MIRQLYEKFMLAYNAQEEEREELKAIEKEAFMRKSRILADMEGERKAEIVYNRVSK